MRLLDLYCGAGGAAVGYHRAGFEVVGVDLNPQPNFPYEFIAGDALLTLMAMIEDGRVRDFDAIHASPPCQAFSLATAYHGTQANHPDLIEPTRSLLSETGLPWVIENVPGAPIRKDVLLCGEMFGLRVHRHRYFECDGFPVTRPPHPRHRLKGAMHNCHIEEGHARLVAGNYSNHADASEAMGIDWMTRKELAQAIPPAYTVWMGVRLRAHIAPGALR